MYIIEITPRLLHFKQPAGTSRGTYTTRKVWYILLSSTEHPERTGIGECAPLPNLSCDDVPDYEQILADACRQLEKKRYVLHRFLAQLPLHSVWPGNRLAAL